MFREPALVRALVAAVAIERAAAIDRNDVAHAGVEKHFDRRGAGRAAARDHDLQVFEPLPNDPRGVDQRGQDHDGRAVLVVVHDGNVERFDQALFNFEAARRADVFEVDAAEDRRDAYDRLDDLVHVFGIEADRKRVDVGELLKSIALPSITGSAASGPMSPKPKTAVPSVTTATVLRLIVSWNALLGSAAIAIETRATPGV